MNDTPFNGDLYIKKQTEEIIKRLDNTTGSLYLEVGGHFLIDNHASRVLPGYYPDSKRQIFKQLQKQAKLSIIFCINAKDVVWDRQFSQKYISFEKHLLQELESIEETFNEDQAKDHKVIVNICITMLDKDYTPPHVRDLERNLIQKGYSIYHKYMIENYPSDIAGIVSKDGYGIDEYIPHTKNATQKSIILVSACGSNSGKFNSCLSQLYKDQEIETTTSYAKFETFPIRNLAVNHPTNLAYEAATADIGDYNMIDPYYNKNKGIISTNYNRDIEAFEILQSFTTHKHFKKHQIVIPNSPTEMGINTVGFCFNDKRDTEKELFDAAYTEIQNRLSMYNKLLYSGHGEEEAVNKCKLLLTKLDEQKTHIVHQRYNSEMKGGICVGCTV